MCDKEYAWNPSNCECECDKSCYVGEYLDYENCKCKKRLINKLVDKCTETVEEVKLANIILLKMKMKIVINAFLVQCILCYFQYFSQLMLV